MPGVLYNSRLPVPGFRALQGLTPLQVPNHASFLYTISNHAFFPTMTLFKIISPSRGREASFLRIPTSHQSLQGLNLPMYTGDWARERATPWPPRATAHRSGPRSLRIPHHTWFSLRATSLLSTLESEIKKVPTIQRKLVRYRPCLTKMVHWYKLLEVT